MLYLALLSHGLALHTIGSVKYSERAHPIQLSQNGRIYWVDQQLGCCCSLIGYGDSAPTCVYRRSEEIT